METNRSSQSSNGLRRLCRRDDRMLTGVAGGLADYLDLDVSVIRMVFVALAVIGGVGIPLYLAGWLLMPDERTGRSAADDLIRSVGLER